MPQANWRARIFRELALSVSPSLEMAAEGSTPEVDFALSVSPSLEMGVASRDAEMGLSVSPRLDMAAQPINAAEFSLSVSPRLAMSAVGTSVADFALSVSPTLAMTAETVMAVAYAAGGNGGSSTSGKTFSWTDTVGGNYAVAEVFSGSSSTVTSITCGGESMTLLGSEPADDNDALGTLQLFGLADPPTGTQTFAVTMSVSAAASGGSASYSNVGSVSTAQTSFASTGHTLTQSVSCDANEVIVQAFGSTALSGGSATASGGTNRWDIYSQGGAKSTLSDATESTTFGITTIANGFLSGVAVILSPA